MSALHPRHHTLQSLSRLVASTRSGFPIRLKPRIEFVAVAYRYHLIDGLRNYDFYDQYGIGGRHLDSCFEMYDSDNVVHGLMEQASRDPALMEALQDDMDKTQLSEWRTVHQQIANGNNMTFDF